MTEGLEGGLEGEGAEHGGRLEGIGGDANTYADMLNPVAPV